MLRQRFEIVKQNNNLKQYIPTADMLGLSCSFTGSVYSFNDCTEQATVKVLMSEICAGIALHIMIKNTLNRLRREIQAGGFFFVSEQAPEVSLCRSLVRIFLTDADGTGTRMLKKEKREKKMETRFYTV